MGAAIEVRGLGKRYRLGEDFGRYLTIRESLASLGRRRHRRPDHELWALRDVDLSVEEGEVLGVVGRNGAGKTTLLKILARITEPTTGLTRTRGRVGALLDVGTGFHPELTGRENVYLNGAILGMSRADIRRRFDEIIEFAGVERFLDTPLKRYSAGMTMRLAFAVAAHLRTRIVAVDEVLAVGDVEFEQKSLGKMAEMTGAGRTVVFVSHHLSAIRQLCTRTVWLDHGQVVSDGPTAQVIEEYLKSGVTASTSVELDGDGTGPVELLRVMVTDQAGTPLDLPRRDRPLAVRVRFAVRSPLPDLDAAIYLSDRSGTRVLDETFSETVKGWRGMMDEPGEYEAVLVVPPVLAAGTYIVGVWFGAWIGTVEETFVSREVLDLQIWPHPHDRADESPRIVRPPVEWELNRTS